MRVCVCVAEAHSAGDWEEEDEGRNRETHKQIGKKRKRNLKGEVEETHSHWICSFLHGRLRGGVGWVGA